MPSAMPPAMPNEAHEVTIERLGAGGDGVARDGTGETRFVPGALPGERWLIGAADGPQRITSAPERQAPVCRHFGTCGGCIAQHMSRDLYHRWKRETVVQAFAHRGLDPVIAPLREVQARSRRRAVLGVARRGASVRIGFREEGRHSLVDLSECPVLDPAIVSAFPVLREIATLCMPEGITGRLLVTSTKTGLDVVLDSLAEGRRRQLDAAARLRLAEIAATARLCRLIIDGLEVAVRAPPTLVFADVPVEIPTGSFVQAVPEAETMMTDAVLAGIGKAKRVVDLFCGLGTFTFPLARRFPVLAIDGDRRAVAALETAARHVQGLRKIETKVRDLFHEPLSPRELDKIDAVVFDPPRAGAKAQAESLARSKVRTVVAVSCNPATLARDVRILVDGGYTLDGVTPVDQFVYSAHVEAVAVLRR